MEREKRKQYHLPPQTGLAFTVKKGEVIRIIDTDGEQVSDLVCFAQNDSSEYFSSGRTVDYNNRLFLTFEISYGATEPHPNCLDNLNMNLAAYEVNADHIAAPFNIFLNVSISENGELGILPPRTKAGDFIELRAEMDLIVGITACSAGACNNYHCTAIDVEIYSDHNAAQ
jgi:uncharacterized protein YcgI (DUF1989 family)